MDAMLKLKWVMDQMSHSLKPQPFMTQKLMSLLLILLPLQLLNGGLEIWEDFLTLQW